MLHWSQEASTGWTRNSWFGSMATIRSPASSGGGIRLACRARPTPGDRRGRMLHDDAHGCTPRSGALAGRNRSVASACSRPAPRSPGGCRIDAEHRARLRSRWSVSGRPGAPEPDSVAEPARAPEAPHRGAVRRRRRLRVRRRGAAAARPVGAGPIRGVAAPGARAAPVACRRAARLPCRLATTCRRAARVPPRASPWIRAGRPGSPSPTPAPSPTGCSALALAAQERLREARRAYDAARGPSRCGPPRRPIRRPSAPRRTRRRPSFRSARLGARERGALEAAAREWLREIDRINARTREAVRLLAREHAAEAGLLLAVERLGVEADGARIAAESAAEACRNARIALAACEESERLGHGRSARDRSCWSRPRSSPAQPGLRRPSPAPTGGAAARSRARAAADAARVRRREPAILPLLAGSRDVLRRIAATLAEGDAEAQRRWEGQLAALVDAVRARAIDGAALIFPDEGFWAPYTQVQRREIAAALAALGYRFDGNEGFADGRVPGQRELSLAIGYAGLDPMRIRIWPIGGGAAAPLRRRRGRCRALRRRGSRRADARRDDRPAGAPGRGAQRPLERLGPRPPPSPRPGLTPAPATPPGRPQPQPAPRLVRPLVRIVVDHDDPERLGGRDADRLALLGRPRPGSAPRGRPGRRPGWRGSAARRSCGRASPVTSTQAVGAFGQKR